MHPSEESVPPLDSTAADLAFSEGDAEVLGLVGVTVSDGELAWRLNARAHRLSLIRGFDRLLSWPSLRGVVRYDHQERTALRVLREMRGRAILADEVGLGKTIEAGLILKEYVLRGLVRRALLLTPAALVSQWREEMGAKFALEFSHIRSLDDWVGQDFVVASLDRAKRGEHRAAAHRSSWDLVIVDEAHRLRNPSSLNWKFVAGLRKKYMLLLTATPVQNNMDELFSLVSLLKPGQLHTYGTFLERFVATPDRRTPTRVPELRARLRDVMVRNRRDASFDLPPRRVHSLAVRLSRSEQSLYDAVSEFVRDAYGTRTGRLSLPARLTLVVLQREIGSSSFAAAETLARLRESPMFDARERERLSVLHETALGIRDNVKAAGLRAFLRSTDEKVLVFTQYVRTLEYLRGLLAADGHVVAVYFGGLPAPAKDRAVADFRSGARIFLSTEAGGEGRNLQFARTIVNYDLPWNPLRIEQRIGRVHRLGQEREVHVVNLWAEGTIEEYLIELLDRKVHMFELVVGELDMILGNLDERRSFEDLLMDVWTLQRTETRREALRRLGEALVAARASYEEIRGRNEDVLGPALGEASA